MDRDEVDAAFEILLEAVSTAGSSLNEQGAAAFRAGEYEAADRLLAKARRLTEFREKIRALHKEWAAMKSEAPRRKRAARGGAEVRLPRGLRTSEEAFRRPILEALLELGGRARVGEVLERVERKMAGKLTPHDYETLPSDRRCPRWRNTAQWCRNSLVQEGLMRSDSPHGIWEISDLGREFLEKGSS